MKARDWWLGISAIVAAILFHALMPRYEWRPVQGYPAQFVRIDRWFGRAEVMRNGQWTELRRESKPNHLALLAFRNDVSVTSA